MDTAYYSELQHYKPCDKTATHSLDFSKCPVIAKHRPTHTYFHDLNMNELFLIPNFTNAIENSWPHQSVILAGTSFLNNFLSDLKFTCCLANTCYNVQHLQVVAY